MKEGLLSVLAEKVYYPLRRKIEFRTDQRSWTELAQRKIAEAKANGLSPRFAFTNTAGGYYFSIETRNSRTLVFCHDELNNDYGGWNSPTSQVIILDGNNKPRCAYEVEALRDLPKFWHVSAEEEDVENIGNIFRYLKKAKLFDSRQNKDPWRGLPLDVNGLIKELDSSSSE